MPCYFIEMGQGIIAPAEGLMVCSSVLRTCTFICGLNATTNMAGAYHYPAAALDNDAAVVKEMDSWIDALKPTEVVLVFAVNAITGQGSATSVDDQKAMRTWLANRKLVATEKLSASSAMEIAADGSLNAGPGREMKGDFDQPVGLERMKAGAYDMAYGKFTIVGRNIELEKESKTKTPEGKGCCVIL